VRDEIGRQRTRAGRNRAAENAQRQLRRMETALKKESRYTDVRMW
jgi:hypothetical protein